MARKYPISRSVDHQFTVNDLTTLRCELAGEREKAIKRIAEIDASIEQLDGVLRMFGFNDFRALTPLHRFKPVRITRIEGRSRRVALWKLLQENPDGKTTVEIADYLVAKFNLNGSNKSEIAATRNYARKVLNRWQANGKVEVCDFTGQTKRWRLV